MRKLQTNFSKILLALAAMSSGVCAQAQGEESSSTPTTYTDTNVTFAWEKGDGSVKTASVPEAVTSQDFYAGLALTTGEVDYASKVPTLAITKITTYQPAENKNGECAEGYEIDFSLKVKKGITFTLDNVSVDIIKDGTDGPQGSPMLHWAIIEDGAQSEAVGINGENIRRNKNEAPYTDVNPTHTLTVSEAKACRSFTFRVYVSATANNKKIALGNVKINGKLNGTEIIRTFKNFKVDFRSETPLITAPGNALPDGVQITDLGTFNGSQHGRMNTKMTVSVDGPVRFTVGGCTYSNTNFVVKDKDGNVLADRNVSAAGCDNGNVTGGYNKFITWTYNVEEPAVLYLELAQYCPYIMAEACDLLPICDIKYYDQNGTLLGTDKIQGGDPISFKYSESDLTIAEGKKFRGWFNSSTKAGVKITDGYVVEKDLSLYAVVNDIETVTNVSRYDYDLRAVNFYDEDHEAITITNGSFHDAQHGWAFQQNGTIVVPVAGKAIITLGLCKYGNEGEIVVTNKNGDEIERFANMVATDGSQHTLKYDGEATELTFTMTASSYIHTVSAWNVAEFVTYDENIGYFFIPANDVNSFLLALKEANGKGDCKIFLPNGTYDLGEICLTTISGNNIAIIGESMEGTIIRNAPAVENEGIGTTATLLNTSNNLYLQDLTLQNALDYKRSGGAGRAVCLQDKGTNTICKNVRMLSYQDTYYSNAQGDGVVNYYWEDSEIHGVVDYICGGGNVVYNRTKFVNEERDKVTIAAPYQTDACKWGYVMLDCSIENHATTNFNLGRAWNGTPRMAWIRTKFLGDASKKVIATRFTAEGMNVAADKFYEYKSVDETGAVVSPESNIVTFNKNGVENKMETILTDEAAAEYTIENIFGEWAPDAIAAQLVSPEVTLNEGVATWEAVEGATAFLVYVDGEIKEIVPATTLTYEAAGAESVKVRVANGRGGFALAAEDAKTAIVEVEGVKEIASVEYYTLGGARVSAPQKGISVARIVYSDGSSKSRLVSVK